jgi:nucleoside-diphosphate-sugar epimerase
VKQALSAGHSVLAIRRSPTSTPRIALNQHPQWLDRALDEVTAEELKDSEVLVHLAAHTGNVPYDTLANCLRWNLMAVVALFEQARLAGIRRYVVAGSCFEYGKSGERYEEIPTDAPLEPMNSYAASKAAASIALLQWAAEHQVSLDILRLFHVFGEGEPESRLWPSLRRAAMAGANFPMTAGEQLREFLPVQKVATIFLNRACLNPKNEPSINIFNLASHRPCTIREFSEYWWRHWEAKGTLMLGKVAYRDAEVMKYIAGPNSISLQALAVGR